MGDGYKEVSQGTCKGLELDIGLIKFAIDTFLFSLEGIDVVLDMSWLASLGSIRVGWKKQCMCFQLASGLVELNRESSAKST